MCHLLQSWDQMGQSSRLIQGDFAFSKDNRTLDADYVYTAEAQCLPDLGWTTPPQELEVRNTTYIPPKTAVHTSAAHQMLCAWQLELVEVSNDHVAEVAAQELEARRQAGEPEARPCSACGQTPAS